VNEKRVIAITALRLAYALCGKGNAAALEEDYSEEEEQREAEEFAEVVLMR
jgi:hypothetical protein